MEFQQVTSAKLKLLEMITLIFIDDKSTIIKLSLGRNLVGLQILWYVHFRAILMKK
ncbi:hypothetical protein [uncultured Vagococcus sp.]|uniref:hypothetical protein n=1 Tax=uncultured Vagococcus sp. TaxID=189676 RepID=UPI0028D489E3|nr:hypothetical protein [uncultured Vagococcus sp.]